MLLDAIDFIVLFTARQQPLLVDAASIAVKHHLYIARTYVLVVMYDDPENRTRLIYSDV